MIMVIRVIRAKRGWILVVTSMRSKLEMRTRMNTTRFSHFTTKGLFRVSGLGFRSLSKVIRDGAGSGTDDEDVSHHLDRLSPRGFNPHEL